MKRTALILVAMSLLLAQSASAQQRQKLKIYEITGFAGYQFGGGTAVQGGDIRIQSAPNVGLMFDYLALHDLMIEAMWTKQETELRLKETLGNETTLFGTTMSYYHVGVLYLMRRNHALRPFASMTAGLSTIDPKDTSTRTETRFSFALGVGAKWIHESGLGVRVHSRLLLTLLTGGSNVWCGTGGCNVGIIGAAIGQGDVAAGLVLAF